MKKLLFLNLLLAMLFGLQAAKAWDYVTLDSSHFPDAVFRSYLSERLGVAVNGQISKAQADEVTFINLTKNGITSLEGIEWFENLTDLYCSGNNITNLNLRSNTKLVNVYCSSNHIKSIDVKDLTRLNTLQVGSNELTSIDVTTNSNLAYLHLDYNSLSTLNVTNNSKLHSLGCYNCNLSELNVSQNPLLETLSCSENNLSVLNVSQNPLLNYLDCEKNNLNELNVSQNTKLTELDVSQNNLTQLNLTNNPDLIKLDASRNQLKALNLDNNIKLERLECRNNQIYNLDLYECKNLKSIYVQNNRLVAVRGLDQITNPEGNIEFGNQESTRRFKRIAYNSSEENVWALPVTYDSEGRISNLMVDDEEMSPVVYNGCLIVSTDLKQIPKKVTYSFKTFDGKEYMNVTVNYHVVNYGIKIDGKELTSLDMNNIPSVTKGKVYINDEPGQGEDFMGWDNTPTLVMENATIDASGKGLYNVESYNLTIKVIGDCSIISREDHYGQALELDLVTNTYITGGGTLHAVTASTSTQSGMGIHLWDLSHLYLRGNTTLIAECSNGWALYDEELGSFDIEAGSTFCAYSMKTETFSVPGTFTLGEGIALRYPVGGYYDKYRVYYSNGEEVRKDWVVFGPSGATPPAESLAEIIVTTPTTVDFGDIVLELDPVTRTAKVVSKPNVYTGQNYGGYSGDMNIPIEVSYQGIPYKVTSIGENAFWACGSLTSVNIPGSVTSIGDAAFAACGSLTTVTLLNGLTSIGKNAFYSCYSLSNITIPDGVTTIGDDAFNGCSSLKAITIPGSVTYLGAEAFACSGLYSVEIQDGVTSIGDYAFYDCRDMTYAILPSSLTSVGKMSFARCTALVNVYCYAEEAPTAPSDAFDRVDVSNVTLYVPYGSKGSYQAAECWQNFKIREMLSIIDDIAYEFDETALTATVIAKEPLYEGDIVIPSTVDYEGETYRVTRIGKEAFYNCNELTSIVILEGIARIGFGAFYYCRNLSSVTLPESVSIIDRYAFYDCSSLKSITIPKDVTYIGYCAFGGCYNLKEIWCYAVEPPAVDPISDLGAFETLDVSKIMLVVPDESEELYKAHDIWGQFMIETPTPIASPFEETEEGAAIYNLSGQRLSKPANGIIIRNGKKVLVK